MSDDGRSELQDLDAVLRVHMQDRAVGNEASAVLVRTVLALQPLATQPGRSSWGPRALELAYGARDAWAARQWELAGVLVDQAAAVARNGAATVQGSADIAVNAINAVDAAAAAMRRALTEEAVRTERA